MISLTEAKRGKQYRIVWALGIEEKLKELYNLKEDVLITILQNVKGNMILRIQNHTYSLSSDLADKIRVAEEG